MISVSARTPAVLAGNLASEPVRLEASLKPRTILAEGIGQFGRELGSLNRMRKDAARNGEVVTEAKVELAFETAGILLAVKDAAAQFDSRAPAAPVHEPAEPEGGGPSSPAHGDDQRTVMVVREQAQPSLRRIDDLLARLQTPSEAAARPAAGAPFDSTA